MCPGCAGVYSLELAARYARSTLLMLEPNRSVWEQVLLTTTTTHYYYSLLSPTNRSVWEQVLLPTHAYPSPSPSLNPKP